MRAQVLGTFSLKLASAAASFALLTLTTQLLGASGRGVISIVVTSVALIGLVNGFVGGASVVYLLSKNKGRRYGRQIALIAYAWAAVSSAAVTLGAAMSHAVEAPLIPHLFAIGVLAAGTAINALLLLSAGSLLLYNATNVIQTLSTLVFFGITALLPGGTSIGWYLAALYVAYFLCLVLTFWRLTSVGAGLEDDGSEPRLAETIGSAFRHGGLAQVGNLLMFISYRLSFYILGAHEGTASVGIYSVAVMLSESLWMISGSFAIVLYAHASRSENNAELVDRTLRYSKFCALVSLVCVAVLLAVPQAVFAKVFGAEFGAVKACVGALCVGMISTSAGTIVNHYFAGLGMYGINARIALVGFVVSVAGNVILVPSLGLIGAGVTASAANLVVCAGLFRVFLRHNALAPAALLPTRADWRRLTAVFRR